MPSIPQSLLWISLVVLWLFVLVPMLINKRDTVRRTSDVALATRVLDSDTKSRLFRRSGPSAGHRHDPDWQQADEFDDDYPDQVDEIEEYDDAVRAARAYTGRKEIIKIEGGYHGGYDGLSVSVKPAIDEIGPADDPIPQVPFDVEPGVVHTVSYDDIGQMERKLAAHGKRVACVVMEPVIENLGIVLPDAGYLADVRALCDAHNVLLIFDEVKTGLTAGAHGAAARLGVKPDLITLAKSIGGGLPLAAFGGTEEVMQVVVDNRMAHFGTYNGNPLCMAAALAVDEVATPQALAAAEQVNDNAMEAMDTIIREYELPAHTVGFGVKGAVTWSPTPIRNYRDYKLSTDFEVAELGWLWGINRGILTPPGMDDQWLVSLAHTDADMGKWVDAFGELAKELRA